MLAVFVTALIGLAYSMISASQKFDTEICIADLESDALYARETEVFEVEFGSKAETGKQVVTFSSIFEVNENLSLQPSEQVESNLRDRSLQEKTQEWIKKVLKREDKAKIQFSLTETGIEDTRGDLSDSLQRKFEDQIKDSSNEQLQLEVEQLLLSDVDITTETEVITDEDTSAGSVTTEYVINSEVVDRTDIKYQVIEGKGLKEEIVIKKTEGMSSDCLERALSQSVDKIAETCNLPKNQYIFEFKLDPEIEVHRTLTGTKDKPGGVWYFTDKYGRYLAHIEPLFAIDSAESRTNSVYLDIDEERGTMTVTLDLDWLLDSKRVYPVTIDPSIVHDTESEFDAGAALNRIESISGPKVQTPYHELPADEHTVGLWHMNNDWTDSSGEGNNGTAYGNATFTTSAKLGSHAGTFDGTGDYVSYGNDSSLSADSMTWEVWVKSASATNPSDYKGVLFKAADTSANREMGLMFNTSGHLAFSIGDGSANLSSGVNEDYYDAIWHHVACVKEYGASGDTTKIYMDGILKDSDVHTTHGVQNTSDLESGRVSSSSTAARYFNGQIDEVRISNRALTPEEIKANAQRRPYGVYTSDVLDLTTDVTAIDSLQWTENGVQTGDGETVYDDTGLVAQWNFNENSGTTATNNGGASSCGGTPANCNGTLIGFSNTTGQDVVVGSGWTANNARWPRSAPEGLMFDGSSDYVNVGSSSSLDVNDVFTIAAWVNPSISTLNTIYISQRVDVAEGGIQFRISSTNKLQLLKASIAVLGTSNTAINTGEWTHVAVTYDSSGNYTFYRNGIEDGSGTDVQSFVYGEALIGTRKQWGASDWEYFNGFIDSPRIYSRVLGADEILSNYQAGNIEFQTRTGTDDSPDDGSWEAWTPVTSESQLLSMDSDVLNWGATWQGGQWYDASWTKRTKITIQSSKVNADLTDYPVYVDLSDLPSGFHTNVKSDGSDIRITKADGITEVPREIVNYNSGTDTGEVHFKASGILSSSSNTDFYIYYGNSGASDYAEDATYGRENVWVNYAMIQHMDDVTTSSTKDSTSNDNDGTKKGANEPIEATGQIEEGQHCDGSDDYVNAGTNASLDISTGTVSLWFYRDNLNIHSEVIVAKDNSGYNPGDFAIQALQSDDSSNPNKIQIFSTENATPTEHFIYSNSAISAATWVHIVYSFGSGGMKMYIDGVEQNDTDTNTVGLSNTSASFFMGVRRVGDDPFDGIIDEVRISSTARTSTWISTVYNNQNSSSTFYSVGNEESVPTSFSNDSIVKTEGTGSLKIQQGVPQVDSNTVALWHLDETNGDLAGDDVFDETADNNDGELNGTAPGPEPVEGIFGKAREFNGSDDYISIPHNTILEPAEISVSAWIKPSIDYSGSTHFGLFKKDGNSTTANGGGYNLFYYNSMLRFYLNTDGDASWDCLPLIATSFTADNWYYIVGTKNSSGGYLYINGMLVNEVVTSECQTDITYQSYTNPAYVGVDHGGSWGTAYFNGIIDEVRISNTARTAEEIAEAYRMGRDHRLSRTISSADLSGKTKLPFYIAADRAGTYLESTIGESTYANYLPDANTVGLWHLEEDSGYCDSGEIGCVKDSSSSGNDGTPSGNPTTTQGKIGKGWDFDVSSVDYINIPDDSSLDISDNMTVELWFKRDISGVTHTLASKNYRNWEIMISSSDKIIGYKYGTHDSWCGWKIIGDGPTIENNKWYYLTIVFSGVYPTVYLDNQSYGTEYVTYACSSGLNPNSDPLNIGRRVPTYSYNFDGIIDEVRISNTARTPEQIRQAYEIGRRTHPITIDFSSNLHSDNLIANSSDLSFELNNINGSGQPQGLPLHVGERVIVKENYGGTEYIAQGTVTNVNTSTFVVTVASWDAGSTFPSGGYTVNTTVFKWQREYWDVTGPLSSHINAATNLTLRVTDGSEGRTFWLDDFKSGGTYLTDGTATGNVSSTVQQYMQYRAIFTTHSTWVTPWLSDVTVNYTAGPQVNQLMRHGKYFSGGEKQPFWWAR